MVTLNVSNVSTITFTKLEDAEICVCTQELDYPNVQEEEYKWAKSVLCDVSEVVPKDVPEPLGKCITLPHYVYANLYHDMLTGHSITGSLHFLNKAPIDWYSKKQATVETTTYGSEFIAAYTCLC